MSAVDSNGSVALGYRGTVTLSSNDPGAVLPGSHSFTPTDRGSYTFPGLVFKTAGNLSITASDGDVSGQTSVSIGPGAAARLELSSIIRRWKTGTAESVTVAAMDSFANVADAYTGTIHFTSSDPAATLPPDFQFRLADSGVVTVPGFTLRTSGPSASIAAADMATSSIAGSLSIPLGGTTGAKVVADLAAAIAAGKSSVDVFGDGTVTYSRTMTGSTLQAETMVETATGLPYLSNTFGATNVYREYDGKSLRRMTEETALASGQGPVSYRITEYTPYPATEPDVRKTYTYDPNQPDTDVRREEDWDHNGNWLDKGTSLVPTIDEDFSIPASNSGCSPQQISDLNRAFADAKDQGVTCLEEVAFSMALKFALALGGTSYTVKCAPQAKPGSRTCAEYGSARDTIIVYPSGFAGACGDLAAVMMHEVLHDPRLLGKHDDNDNQNNNPGDRIVGCAKLCFGRGPTQQDCAQCLGKKNGEDPHCNRYPPKPCQKIFCGCNGKYYDSSSPCVPDCHDPGGGTTLKCYGNTICGPPPSGPCR